MADRKEDTIEKIPESQKPIYKIVSSWNLFDAERGLQMEPGTLYFVDDNGACMGLGTRKQFLLAWDFLCKHQDLWNEENAAKS